MRLTSSYAVFQADPGEEELSRARWYGREGKSGAAIDEYRRVLASRPDLAAGWMELFELLRHEGRLEDALTTAADAAGHFGPAAAMPLALKGAALAELGRIREAVEALEGALERDGNLALAWHELAHAAWRVGEHARALLALDRAFALEPHTDTLMLRGRILRDAGQYEAALVAFEGAQQSAEHEPQRRDAEAEIGATRRAASLGGGRRPRQFSTGERHFAELGVVVIDPDPGVGAEPLARAIATLPVLVRAAAWHPAAIAALKPSDQSLAEAIGTALDTSVITLAALDPADQPLVVTVFAGGGEEWNKQMHRLDRWATGTTFALVQSGRFSPGADVAGVLGAHDEQAVLGVLATAIEQALLMEPLPVSGPAALLASAEAPWRRRIAGGMEQAM
jgi:tetratricopeptide (TPR) repeat protein